MTDELKLKLIQQHIQTYYEAGGAALPSAYKSAVLDMLDMIAHGEIETAEERIVKDELKRIEETMSHVPKDKQEEIVKDTTAAFERAWEQIKQHSKYNSAVADPNHNLHAVNAETDAGSKKQPKNSPDEVNFIVKATMKKRWVDNFCSMLMQMQDNGVMGHSEILRFYSDGDGDFRPKFEVEGVNFKIISPVQKIRMQGKEEIKILVYDAG